MTDHHLNARIDRILAETAAVRGGMQRLTLQGEQIMATQQQILAALTDSVAAAGKAQIALRTLENENADLKSQLASANAKASAGIDGSALDAAVDDASAQAKALSGAIPAGAGETIVGTSNDTGSPPSVIVATDATKTGPVDHLADEPTVVGTPTADAISIDHAEIEGAQHVAL